MSDKNWEDDKPTEFLGGPDDLGDPGIEDNTYDLDKDFVLDDDPVDEPLNLGDDEPTEVMGNNEPTEFIGYPDEPTEFIDSGEVNNEAWSESKMEWGLPDSFDSTPTHSMEPIEDFADDEPNLMEEYEAMSARVDDLTTDNNALKEENESLRDDNFTLSNNIEDNINAQRMNKILYGIIAALVVLTIGVSWWGASNSGEASRIAGENAIGQRENMSKEEQISVLEEQIANEQKKIDDLQNTIKGKDREISELNGKVSSRAGEIDSAIAARDSAIGERDAANRRVGELEKRLKEAESKPDSTTTATTTVTERETSIIQSPPQTVTSTVTVPEPSPGGGDTGIDAG